MQESRLAVNNDKTQIMCLASKRKRAAMKAKGETSKMRITAEEHSIEEIEYGTVVGVTWNRDLRLKKNTEMFAECFNTKFYGVSRAARYLTQERRIQLVL